MKKIFLYMLLAALPAFSLSAVEEQVKNNKTGTNDSETTKNNVQNIESLTWSNKKFSIGIEAFNGFGINSGLSLMQLNSRIWLSPNFQLSLHGSIDLIIPTNLFSLFVMPILVNAGYGNSIKNMYWLVEGGGGVTMDDRGLELFTMNIAFDNKPNIFF